MEFFQKADYKKIKFRGLYQIKKYNTMLLLYDCDNGQILVESLEGNPIIFIDEEFLEECFNKLGPNKLLELLYAL